jgi:hypothetical protein
MKDTLKNDLLKDGYSKEDQYFYEQDLKLKKKIQEDQKKALSKVPEGELKIAPQGDRK